MTESFGADGPVPVEPAWEFPAYIHWLESWFHNRGTRAPTNWRLPVTSV